MPDVSLLLPLDHFQVRPMDRGMNKTMEKDLAKIDPEACAA